MRYAVFRAAGLSFRWRPWGLAVNLLLAGFIAVAVVAALTIGDYPLSFFDVVRILFDGRGGAGASLGENLVVWQWRLPRVATAVIVGFALGLSGALMQSVARNALASPDVLGVTSGAAVSAVAVIVAGQSGGVLGWLSGMGVAAAALVGGILTGVLMWLCAWRRGADPLRLVLCGIIFAALAQAVLYFLISRADIHDASQATLWLHGSLSSPDWSKLRPAAIIAVLVVALVGWLNFRIAAHCLGPSVAQALGEKPQVTQLWLLGLSVVLASVAVAVTGPIRFIAFVGPQIAIRLVAAATPPLFTSGLVSALLLLGADVVVQLLPTELPVGVVTSAMGGVFLMYMLVRHNRGVSAAR